MKRWMTGAQGGALAGFGALLLCQAMPVTAGEFEYRFSAGSGYSDNPGHLATDEESTSFATASTRFSFYDRTPHVQADVVGDLAYYKYFNDLFDPELVGNVYAVGSFAIVPERFIWAVSDQFGQLATDPFLPIGPNNREDINTFSTGPDFIVGLGSQARLRVGARYSLYDYEDHAFDSAVTGGQLAVIRDLSASSSVSLNASVQQFEYDDETLNANFDQQDVYLRYEAEGGRTNLAINAGYSQLDRDAFAEKESGPMVRLDASRRISGSSVLSLEGGREFSTSAGAFASEQGGSYTGIGAAPGQQSADPFTQDHATFSWAYDRNVTGLTAAISWEDRTYDHDPVLDQTSMTLSARYRRDLSPTTTLSVSAAQVMVRYEPPAVDYDELAAGVAFTWRLSRSLALEASYDFSHRGKDVSFAGYSENRLWLSIGFGRGEPRRTRIPPAFGVDSATTPGR